MKISNSNRGYTIELSNELASRLLLAMDVYYETVQSVVKEKDIKGTVSEITTKLFKGEQLKVNFEGLPEDVVISKVQLGSFGLEVFLKNRNESVIIGYDSIKKKL